MCMRISWAEVGLRPTKCIKQTDWACRSRQPPDGSAIPFEMLLCGRLPCLLNWWTWRKLSLWERSSITTLAACRATRKKGKVRHRWQCVNQTHPWLFHYDYRRVRWSQEMQPWLSRSEIVVHANSITITLYFTWSTPRNPFPENVPSPNRSTGTSAPEFMVLAIMYQYLSMKTQKLQLCYCPHGTI